MTEFSRNNESNLGNDSRTNEDLREDLEYGEFFLREMSEIPDQAKVEFNACEKMLGTFLEMPQHPNNYGYKTSGRLSKITAFGLEAPFMHDGKNYGDTVFPFNNEVLWTIHREVTALLVKRFLKSHTSLDGYWSDQERLWGSTFGNELLKQEIERSDEDIDQQFEYEWQRIEEGFGNNAIYDGIDEEIDKNKSEKDQKKERDEKRRERRDAFLVDNGFLTQEETVEYNDYAKNILEKRKACIDGIVRALLSQSSSTLARSRFEFLIEELRGDLAKIEDQDRKKIFEEYRASSRFRYSDMVCKKLKKWIPHENRSVDFDDMLAKCRKIVSNPNDDSIEEARRILEEHELYIRKNFDIRIKREEGMIMAGRPPMIEKDNWKRRRDAKKEERKLALKQNAHAKYQEITRGLANNLGVPPQFVNESSKIIIYPTGITVVNDDRIDYEMAFSPLDQKIVNCLPPDSRAAWLTVWRTRYNDSGQRVQRENNGGSYYSDYEKFVRGVVNSLIERRLGDYFESAKSPETYLRDICKEKSITVDSLINVSNGFLNPQLYSSDVAVLLRIVSPFFDSISKIKKERFSPIVPLHSLKAQTRDFLGGKIEILKNRIVRAGVLDIGFLNNLLKDDKTNGKLTINLLSNDIGIDIYSGLPRELKTKFDSLVDKQSRVSAASFANAFGNYVYDSEKRQKLMRRILFVSYFGQYVVGKAPPFFNNFMKEIRYGYSAGE